MKASYQEPPTDNIDCSAAPFFIILGNNVQLVVAIIFTPVSHIVEHIWMKEYLGKPAEKKNKEHWGPISRMIFLL